MEERNKQLTKVEQALIILKEKENDEDTQLYNLKLQNLMLLKKFFSRGYRENKKNKNTIRKKAERDNFNKAR